MYQLYKSSVNFHCWFRSHVDGPWKRKFGSLRGVTDVIAFTLKALLFAFLHLIINKLSNDKWNYLLRQPGWVEGFLLKDRWSIRCAYCFSLAKNWRGGDQGQREWINTKFHHRADFWSETGARREDYNFGLKPFFLKSTYYFKMTSMASLFLNLHFLSYKRELLLSAL